MYWNKNNHVLFFGIGGKYEPDDGNHENKKKVCPNSKQKD